MQLIHLSYDSGTKTAGEQGDYYDPLFTYKEGDEASYFVVSEDSGVTRLVSVLQVSVPRRRARTPQALGDGLRSLQRA